MSSTFPSWYVAGEGQQPLGPFAAEQLLQSWRAGKLSNTTMCWREGMAQWLPLAQVEPFASAIRRAAAGPQDQVAPPPSSIRGNLSLTGWPHLPPRLVAPLIGVSIVGVLAVALAIVLLRGGSGGFGFGDKASRNTATLADIIADYATRLKEAHNAPQTDIQRQEAVAAAVAELKARVEKCGTVAFTGKVAEIIPEGAMPDVPWVSWKTRNRWGITMSAPQEFEEAVRDGTCTFGCKVWVELEKKDALSIQKGDPITVRGTVSYVQGSVFGGSDCVDIQVWPNSKESVATYFRMGNLGTPQTIAVPISGSVTCSVGQFKSLRVHTFNGE